MSLLHLPPELLLLITRDFIDPLDLLDLRLTHPLFDVLLLPRFKSSFPLETYMPKSPSTGRRTYSSANRMLFFAVEQNYPRLLRRVLDDRWPSGDPIIIVGVRLACIDAARLGNVTTMSQLLDYTAGHFGDTFRESWMLACVDAALSYDHFDVSVALFKMGLCPSRENDRGGTVFSMVMEAHRLDVLHYIIGVYDGEIYGNHWSDPAREEIEYGLNVYIQSQEENGANEWCQRILYTNIRRLGPDHVGDLFLTKADVAVIGMLERRRCGPECDVWFSDNFWGNRTVMLGKEEMVQELEKFRRGVYLAASGRRLGEEGEGMDTAE